MSFVGRLAGKTAVVTGGGSGIGRSISKLFAKEGASVVMMDINTKGMDETLSKMAASDGTKHCAIEADITSPKQVQFAFKKAEEELGKKSTLLVNGAGIIRGSLFDEMAEERFEEVINTNLTGTFHMMKYFLNSLKEATEISSDERGVVVNVASIAGKCGFFRNAEYSAAKAGVIGLTKTLAQEYPKHKIRCNAVLPGMTDTPMTDEFDGLTIERGLRQVPMRRLCAPEEVANVCLFLASHESSFVNGACVEVTGGFGL